MRGYFLWIEEMLPAERHHLLHSPYRTVNSEQVFLPQEPYIDEITSDPFIQTWRDSQTNELIIQGGTERE